MKVNNYGQYYLEEVYEYKEDLSIKDYLELHQQLWNYIIKLLLSKPQLDSYAIKKLAYISTGQNTKVTKIPLCFCWGCEVANKFDKITNNCSFCLLDWGDRPCHAYFKSIYSLYEEAIGKEDYLFSAEYAAIIRDLLLNKRYEDEKE